MNGGVISLIEEVELSEDCTYDIHKCGNVLCIIIGTSRVNDPNEIIIQEKSNPSFLESDSNKYRVYKFDCCHRLQKIYVNNFNSILDVAFYTDGNSIFINQTTETGYPRMFELVQVNEYKCPLRFKSITSKISIPRFKINFSLNGEWAIVTGAKPNPLNEETDPYKLQNIQLYKVCCK